MATMNETIHSGNIWRRSSYKPNEKKEQKKSKKKSRTGSIASLAPQLWPRPIGLHSTLIAFWYGGGGGGGGGGTGGGRGRGRGRGRGNSIAAFRSPRNQTGYRRSLYTDSQPITLIAEGSKWFVDNRRKKSVPFVLFTLTIGLRTFTTLHEKRSGRS
ncbi:hypothetical protein V1478_008895, partial [Vespula squamosa]